MSKQDMYDNLEQAEGNDLIDEHNQLWLEIAGALKDSGVDEQKLGWFEEITRELTRREQ